MILKTKKCECCGAEFEYLRSSRKTCSDRCRARVFRKPDLSPRVDPFTGKTFIPKRSDQIYAVASNRQRHMNKQVLSMAKQTQQEVFSLIDTKEKRQIKKNLSNALRIIIRMIEVAAGKHGDAVTSTERNIIRSMLTAPYLHQPQRGFRQLLAFKGMAKSEDRLMTKRNYQRALIKAEGEYRNRIRQLFYMGNMSLKTIAQLTNDFCLKHLNCTVFEFVKNGFGLSRLRGVQFSDEAEEIFDLNAVINRAMFDSVIGDRKPESEISRRSGLPSISRALLNIQKKSFGRAIAT